MAAEVLCCAPPSSLRRHHRHHHHHLNPKGRPRRLQSARPRPIVAGSAPPPMGLADGVYAGTAFSASPSPSALPLPRWNRGAARREPIDRLATRDLRRLLRLEL